MIFALFASFLLSISGFVDVPAKINHRAHREHRGRILVLSVPSVCSVVKNERPGEGLLLYYSSSCPYSHKVIRYLEETHQTIPMKEINCDKEAKAEFKARGDSMVVPCLYIDGKPLYESDAIINWLKTHPERTSHAQQSA